MKNLRKMVMWLTSLLLCVCMMLVPVKAMASSVSSGDSVSSSDVLPVPYVNTVKTYNASNVMLLSEPGYTSLVRLQKRVSGSWQTVSETNYSIGEVVDTTKSYGQMICLVNGLDGQFGNGSLTIDFDFSVASTYGKYNYNISSRDADGNILEKYDIEPGNNVIVFEGDLSSISYLRFYIGTNDNDTASFDFCINSIDYESSDVEVWKTARMVGQFTGSYTNGHYSDTTTLTDSVSSISFTDFTWLEGNQFITGNEYLIKDGSFTVTLADVESPESFTVTEVLSGSVSSIVPNDSRNVVAQTSSFVYDGNMNFLDYGRSYYKISGKATERVTALNAYRCRATIATACQYVMTFEYQGTMHGENTGESVEDYIEIDGSIQLSYNNGMKVDESGEVVEAPNWQTSEPVDIDHQNDYYVFYSNSVFPDAVIPTTEVYYYDYYGNLIGSETFTYDEDHRTYQLTVPTDAYYYITVNNCDTGDDEGYPSADSYKTYYKFDVTNTVPDGVYDVPPIDIILPGNENIVMPDDADFYGEVGAWDGTVDVYAPGVYAPLVGKFNTKYDIEDFNMIISDSGSYSGTSSEEAGSSGSYSSSGTGSVDSATIIPKQYVGLYEANIPVNITINNIKPGYIYNGTVHKFVEIDISNAFPSGMDSPKYMAVSAEPFTAEGITCSLEYNDSSSPTKARLKVRLDAYMSPQDTIVIPINLNVRLIANNKNSGTYLGNLTLKPSEVDDYGGQLYYYSDLRDVPSEDGYHAYQNQQIIDSINAGNEGIISNIGNYFRTLFTNLENLFTSLTQSIADNFTTMTENLRNWHDNLLLNLSNWFQGLSDNITTNFDRFFEEDAEQHEEIVNGYEGSDTTVANDSFNAGAEELDGIESELSDASNYYIDNYTTNAFDSGFLTTLGPGMVYVVTWFTNFWNMGGLFTTVLNAGLALFVAFFILRFKR